MSIPDTFKKHEVDWLDSSTLAKLHAKERMISERQAYRDIEEALKKNQIIRKVLPTKPSKTYYGLPASPPLKELQTREGFHYVVPFQGFREYRNIYERLTSMEKNSVDQKTLDHKKLLKAILDNVCSNCPRKLEEPPALSEFCSPCMKRKTTLYSLAQKQLGGLVTDSQRPTAIHFYLISEFKEKMFMLCYRELMDAKKRMPEETFEVCAQATYERLKRLRFFDASLEPKIPEWIVMGLLEWDLEKGQEAIHKAMKAVKWHLIEGGTYEPTKRLVDRNKEEAREWDELYTDCLLKARKDAR